MDNRFIGLIEWTTAVLGRKPQDVVALSNDASPRRYFVLPQEGVILVDTPIPIEQNKAFIAIAKTFSQHQLKVPQVFRHDLAQGYMMISDLGRRLYLSELNSNTVGKLYGEALEELVTLQTIAPEAIQGHAIEHFNHRFILREGLLCQEWFIEKYLHIELSAHERQALQKTFSLLTLNSLEQPQVLVHRDYHSRNLLVCDSEKPGIIDFQDAVWGAVTYDLVSLLRDCYIAWPPEHVEKWVGAFQLHLQDRGMIPTVSQEQFMKWFDLSGAQRHLKALGIFARCDLLYNKPGYLKDMPRTLHYVIDVAKKYPELHFLRQFINERIMPQFNEVAKVVSA